MMVVVITRQRAVELVETLLAEQQGQQPTLPELAVSGVQEHVFGWLVHWQSVDYLRSRDFRKMLIGHGPYLVDREDGRIHHIPVTVLDGTWEEPYLVRQPPFEILLVNRGGCEAATA